MAIQAAYDVCYNGDVQPYGGIVQFPGDHQYVITSYIKAYDGCQTEGSASDGGVSCSVAMEWDKSL